MRRRPPRSTRTDTLFPYTTLFRSINYREEDFVEVIKQATGGKGVDVVLDMVGGDYIPRNIKAMAEDGRLSFIAFRSEEHTSELQSLMRISYAVFCLKKKNKKQHKKQLKIINKESHNRNNKKI